MQERLIALKGGHILTPILSIPSGTVLVRGERIEEVADAEAISIPPGTEVIDVSGKFVCPGFIEVHIHGYAGVMMGRPDTSPRQATGTIDGDILAVARMLPSTGITSFLPTFLAADSLDSIMDMLECASIAFGNLEGAEILGFHMEGPFFSTAQKGPFDRYPPTGAIPVELARSPSIDELHKMVDALSGNLIMVSLSPEIEGALELIRQMSKLGIVASGAHSLASYEETIAAVEVGMNTVTHLYNGMRRQDHREPGIIEASLACDQITPQIIADGIHVHPPALEIALRCKGTDNLIVTTDNTPFAGLPSGRYEDSLGRTVEKTDMFVQLIGGPLYGSVMPMNQQLFTLIQTLGLSEDEAINMATVVPAKLINVFHRKGSLEAGKDADIVVLNSDFEVCLTLCRGIEAFQN